MKIRTLLFILTLFLMVLTSCRQNERVPITQAGQAADPTKDDAVIKANQTITRTEDADIESYVKRKGLVMQKTASGVRYNIYHAGYGISPVDGDKVELDYTLSLLNGQQLYSSATEGPKLFRVGYEEAEPGLHEMVKLMKVGDKANVIIPSALAFGLQGDGRSIPRYATLIYDIELKSIRK
jgi:FKBP-type peptidyl-prolyl cis-trans isomerase